MSMKNAFDVKHPFFRPLWIRVLFTAFPLCWAVLEFSNGATVWAVLFGGSGIYLFQQFFVKFDPADYEKPKDSNGGAKTED